MSLDDQRAAAHHQAVEIEARALGCTHPLDDDPDTDSYCCRECNIWLKPICGDRHCTYCAGLIPD